MTDGTLTAQPDTPATLRPASDHDTGATPTAPVGTHNNLGGRDADGAHPISAIDGLQDALDSIETGGGVQLGETSTTAHRGDHGAQAYGHITDTDNPHQVTAAQVGAATAAQGALADSAVQPADLADVATTGAYSDLAGRPDLAAKADLAYVDAELAAKASQTYVDALDGTVASKADKTYVDTQLAGKAATSHTHAQSDITNLTADLAALAAAIDTLQTRTWWVVKQADEPRTTTTQANDAELVLNLPANKVVRLDLSILVGGGTAADIDIDVDPGTGTLTSGVVRGHVQGWSGASFANITNPPVITPGTPVWVGTGTTQDTEITVTAAITTTTATTVRFRWAQHAATGTTTVRKGSTITARV